ncbi:MAG: hypothetical protein ABIQ18_03640, partial [Umezawaea sp.]
MRTYASSDGRVLWDYDAVRKFQGVNGIAGRGSSLPGAGGTVVVDGMVHVHSGYRPHHPSDKSFVLLMQVTRT